MDAARERHIRDLVRQLVQALADGDLENFERIVRDEADQEVLQALRESKLISKCPAEIRTDASSVLTAAGQSHLVPDEAGRFARHLELAILLEDRVAQVRRALGAAVATLPPMGLADLLSVAAKAFDKVITPILGSDTTKRKDQENPVGIAEREWQDRNGVVNDVVSATCLVVNTAVRRVGVGRSLRDGARPAAVGILRRAILIASMSQALEWLRDSVAFGDLDVTSIAWGEEPVVTLEFRDPRRSLLRTLAVRRSVVMEAFGRRPARLMREWLAQNFDAAFRGALDAYDARVGPVQLEREDLDRAAASAEAFEASIDFEDDMLAIASKGDAEVVGRYLAAALLRWHTTAARTIARGLPRSAARRFLPAAIRLDELLAGAPEKALAAVVGRAWEEETVELPATSHWELVRRPFARESAGVALPILFGSSGKWNAAIRERLLAGGPLAKTLGANWELRFAERFQAAGWRVIGKGVRVKRKGETATATDIDLLLLKGDLLLIAQVKALGGGPLNPYDHWRYRKVIEKGCRQARIAHQRLTADKRLIQDVANRRTMEGVARMEPVVLTNMAMFDGWEHDGVPVLGETLLKAITVGSKVDYVDSEHDRVLLTRHFIRKEELDTPTIVKALRSPVELEIAPESGEVAHVDETILGITFRMPQFTVSPQRGGPVLGNHPPTA